jgi:hypothetical protein
LKYFIYRYAPISILSFILSNLLYNLFVIKFHESFSSLFSLLIILNLNIFFFFKLKIFKTSKHNYLKIVSISCFFRLFEYFLFNFLYIYIFREIQSSYIFAATLILSFLIKSAVFYKNSDLN